MTLRSERTEINVSPEFQDKKLLELLKHFEREATICQENGAWYAASVLRGAILEGYLVCLCRTLPEKTEEAVARLRSKFPKRKSFKTSAPLDWSLWELVTVAVEAGWVTDEQTKEGSIFDYVKEARNLVHPGKHVRDYAPFTFNEGSYDLLVVCLEKAINQVIAALENRNQA